LTLFTDRVPRGRLRAPRPRAFERALKGIEAIQKRAMAKAASFLHLIMANQERRAEQFSRAKHIR
jgi:hypothetical protein